jgi:hypothetical protein
LKKPCRKVGRADPGTQLVVFFEMIDDGLVVLLDADPISNIVIALMLIFVMVKVFAKIRFWVWALFLSFVFCRSGFGRC